MNIIRKTLTVTYIALLFVSYSNAKDDFAPLFPFVISHTVSDNVTNMSHLLDAPAGKHGFVRIENGCFVTDAGEVKFNATNLTGAANFPKHQESDKLADRLARFGINCVRLHYMDAPYGNFRNNLEASIYGLNDSLPKASSADPTIDIPFNEEQLDRLDYLIASLKKRGIYVNINLHVLRFKKGYSFFSPTIIASEKEYAKRLLTHVNPYTGLSYANEPSVAMIEINNENSIFRAYNKGNLNNLPEPYSSQFRNKWNVWLKKKYGSVDALKKAWKLNEVPLLQVEQIPEGNFDEDVLIDGKKWQFKLGSSKALAFSKNGVLKITVDQDGDKNYPKLIRNGIKLEKGKSYIVSFKIRCVDGDNNIQLGSVIGEMVRKWKPLGFFNIVKVGKKWSKFEQSFIATEDSNNGQLQLTRFKKGVYEIDDLTIKSGTPIDNKQNLEYGTIAIIKSKSSASLDVKRDFYEFMVDTERSYWLEMYDYIKNTIKAKVPVSGTQLGGFSMAFIQDDLDYVDIHGYWCHPNPNADWKIGNKAMVNSMVRIEDIASERVIGKPYTISEYNHPFPNQYGSEGQPLLHAYGALQGWNGIFQYTWHHRNAPEIGWVSYFFSISERTDVLAHMPSCAAIYLRGDVKEARETIAVKIDYNSYFDRFYRTGKGIAVGINEEGLNPKLALVCKVGVILDGKEEVNPSFVDKEVSNAKVILSDTGELCWNREDSEAAYFTINTVGTKLFTGFPKGRTISIGDVSLKIGKTRMDWATISLVSRFSNRKEKSSTNILLTATGQACNSDMELKAVGKSGLEEVKWGNAPFMVEGIPATIRLPFSASRTRCYSLNPNGDRVQEVSVNEISEGCQITIDPKYKTIWYEIEVK